MELVSIEFGQVTRITRLYRDSGNIYVPALICGLHERYNFVKFTPPAEILASSSITFEIGNFHDHQIDKLSLYSDGFIVVAKIDTNIIDLFITDALTYVKEQFSLEERNIGPPQLRYDSNLVVRGDFHPDRWMSKSVAVAQRRLNELVHGYASDFPGFQAAGFSLYGNPSKVKGLAVDDSVFARRAGMPFEQNLFFSSGPLRPKSPSLSRRLGGRRVALSRGLGANTARVGARTPTAGSRAVGWPGQARP